MVVLWYAVEFLLLVSTPQKQEGLSPTFGSGDGQVTFVIAVARYRTKVVCSVPHHDGKSAAEWEAAGHAGSAVSRGGWAPTLGLPTEPTKQLVQDSVYGMAPPLCKACLLISVNSIWQVSRGHA